MWHAKLFSHPFTFCTFYWAINLFWNGFFFFFFFDKVSPTNLQWMCQAKVAISENDVYTHSHNWTMQHTTSANCLEQLQEAHAWTCEQRWEMAWWNETVALFPASIFSVSSHIHHQPHFWMPANTHLPPPNSIVLFSLQFYLARPTHSPAAQPL